MMRECATAVAWQAYAEFKIFKLNESEPLALSEVSVPAKPPGFKRSGTSRLKA